MNEVTKRDLAKRAGELTASIRDYVRGQVSYWQMVPWLTLEADGRTGHCSNRARAFEYGVWAVEASADRYGYRIYIDLATGELIKPVPFHHERGLIVPADDDHVICLAAHLDELDAVRLIKALRLIAKEPISSYYNSADTEAWRQKTHARLSLKKIFRSEDRRPVPPPGLDS